MIPKRCCADTNQPSAPASINYVCVRRYITGNAPNAAPVAHFSAIVFKLPVPRNRVFSLCNKNLFICRTRRRTHTGKAELHGVDLSHPAVSIYLGRGERGWLAGILRSWLSAAMLGVDIAHPRRALSRYTVCGNVSLCALCC
jgi:hypothetical protein